MIYAIYPSALDRGISQKLFWESSVPDLLDLMASIDREEDRKLKEEVKLRFVHAEATASRIGWLFTDKNKRRESDLYQPWDAYPELYEDEKELSWELKEDAALQLHKQQMEAYAARWNKFRKAKGDG